MDTEIIAGLSGVVLGSILTGLGAWYRLRLKRVAVLNRSLYVLLELHRTILFATGPDFRRMTDLYLKAIEQRIPGFNTSKDRDKFEPMMRNMFTSIFASEIQSYDKGLLDRFNSQCNALAAIAPLLATRINSNRYVRSVMSKLEEYLDSIRRSVEAPASDEAIQQVDDASAAVRQLVTDELIGELKKDALLLSWKCGVITWVSCKRRFSKQNRLKLDQQLEQQIADFVDKLLAQILKK